MGPKVVKESRRTTRDKLEKCACFFQLSLSFVYADGYLFKEMYSECDLKHQEIPGML